MSYKSCKAEANTFCHSLFSAIICGGKIAFVGYITYYLIDKTIQHSGKIKELFSRIEKCEKKS